MLYEYEGLYATDCDSDCPECDGRQETLYKFNDGLETIPCSVRQKRAKKEMLKSMYGI